jgi:hypothetical protein
MSVAGAGCPGVWTVKRLLWLLLSTAVLLAILNLPIGKWPSGTRAYEMAAVRNLHRINIAQIDYYLKYGRYALSLSELGPPANDAVASNTSADLIPDELSKGSRSGYLYNMSATPDGYTANANPQDCEVTATRAFYTDETNVIRNRFRCEPASVLDPEIN